jgi:hypothetical protein
MRLSGTNEVYVVVGLAALSVIAPKLIKPLTGGMAGRAVATGIAAYLALYVSLPVALFWTIAVHASTCSCSGGGGMEYMYGGKEYIGKCDSVMSEDKCKDPCMWHSDTKKCMDKSSM